MQRMLCAVDEMVVKISSLVGGNPDWHSGEPLTISFKKVSPSETVEALWTKVCAVNKWQHAQRKPRAEHGNHA